MSYTVREKGAIQALAFIIPLLEKYEFRWLITGGFACYVYGVSRELTDIDIDIDTGKDSHEFQFLLKDIKSFITQGLLHFVDQNYDNYNVEITYQGQIIDICPMKELKILDALTHAYEPLYVNGFSYADVEMVRFHGMILPLMSKKSIIKNKEMLVWQRESDIKDIEGLKRLIK